MRLKNHISQLVEFLERGIEGSRFSFYVVSAAPREVIESALEGIVPPDHIYGTEFDYDPSTEEVRAVRQVPAGYGKVEVLEEIERHLDISPDRTIYVGDGSSDVHVMLHVNNRDGFTIAVSENQHALADREAHRVERQRPERARAGAAPRRLGRAGDSGRLRLVRIAAARVGAASGPTG